MSTSLYTPEYIQFIYDFIVNLVYTKVVKSLNLNHNNTSEPLINSFIENANTKALWNPIFIELYYPIKYYIEISEISNIYIPEESNPTIYPKYNTFQEYVDYMINLNNTCGLDYSKFIQNMKDNEFQSKLKLKWQSDIKKNALYNKIINDVKTHVFMACNRTDLIKHIRFSDNKMPLFLNIIPFYEYMNIRNAKSPDLEKIKEMIELEFEHVEKYTLNLIYDYIK